MTPQTQTVELYEADYASYAKLVAVLWVIMFTPILLLLRLAVGEAVSREVGTAVGNILLGPVGLAAAYVGGLINAFIVIWAFNVAAGWGGVRVEVTCSRHVAAGQYELRGIGVGSAALVGGMAGLFVSEMLLMVILTLLIRFMPPPSLQTTASVGTMAWGFGLGGFLGGGLNGLLVSLIYNGLARLLGGVRFRMG